MADRIAWCLVAGLVATYAFLRALLRLTQDEREPQTLATSLPFVSPLLGLGTQKTKFFVKLRLGNTQRGPAGCTQPLTVAALHRNERGLPIYTLRMPGSRTYVINSLSLVPALQRQIRVISFHPIEHRAAERVMGLTRSGCDILGANMNHDDSYLGSFVKALHPALSPGPGLDEINQLSAQLLATSLGRRTTASQVDMFEWIRHEVLIATTNAIYGPHNIFKNPKHEAAWL